MYALTGTAYLPPGIDPNPNPRSALPKQYIDKILKEQDLEKL